MTWVRKIGIRGALTSILFYALTGTGFGQAATGALTGTITDPQGLAVPGATVTVRNEATGAELTVVSNEAGIYQFPVLPPGTYIVAASLPGFSAYERSGVTVQLGQTTRVNIPLSLEGVGESLTVTAVAPVVDTTKTEQSQVIGESLIAGLPVGSRRWEQFALLTPGVAQDGAGGAMAVHGLPSMYNRNTVDGASNDEGFEGMARGRADRDNYSYSAASIREIQVTTSNFNAEIGGAAGAAVNAVTKSGTNAFRGELFYNGRYPSFNAFDPASKASAARQGQTATQPVRQQHQYGVFLGGPLMRDKLFFFGGYDGYRKSAPINFTSATDIGSLTCPAQITALQCSAAKDWVLTENLGTFPRRLEQDIAVVKLEYQATQAHRFSTFGNRRDWFQPDGVAVGTSNNSGRLGESAISNKDRWVISSWTAVYGSWINELRHQWARGEALQDSNMGPPGVTIGRTFRYGGLLSHDRQVFPRETRNQISDNFTRVMGAHVLKAGTDINTVDTFTRSARPLVGLYNYNQAISLTGFGTGCSNSGAANFFCLWLLDLYGVNIGDGRTGRHWTTFNQVRDQTQPGNGQTEFGAADQFRYDDFAVYIQDTWQARRNLTVNYGLRYEVQVLPPLEYGNSDRPILEQYTTKMHQDYTGVQPRLGVAWNFAGNSVLRLGGGVFVAKTSGGVLKAARSLSGKKEQNFDCSPTDALCATLTFPDMLFYQLAALPPQRPFTIDGASASQQPLLPFVRNPAGDSCAGNPRCIVRGMHPDAKRPKAYKLEAAVDHQLPGNHAVSASYTFAEGVNLPNHFDVNVAPPKYTKTYDVLDANGAFLQSVTVPFFTERLDPLVGPVMTHVTTFKSWYHGLALSYRRPFTQGLQVLANYTLAKATDLGVGFNASGGGNPNRYSTYGIPNPYDIESEKADSGIDVRHRFTSSVVWAPDLGRGLSNAFVRGFLDGWSLSGTLVSSSGTHYSSAVESSAIQSITVDGRRVSGIGNGMTGVLADTGNGRALWLPRNSFLRPGYATVDVRVAKQFALTNTVDMDLRVEAFNVFNSTLVLDVQQEGNTYAQPGTGLCPATNVNTCMVPVPGFQQTTATSGIVGARQLQFGMKLTF